MIRRSDPRRGDPEWIRSTAAEVYASLGDYGKIIPSWMSHPGVLTFVETGDEGGVEVRRGFILVGFYEPDDLVPKRVVADLLAIGVAPAHQRRGIGRMLLAYALDVARLAHRDPPAAELRLTVADTNEPALRLFREAGFELLDPKHGSYDGGQRALRMRRRL
jgi:ribosomal protein S18 acetylase RimI-like enzyme